MMAKHAILIKHRARKALASGFVNTAVYPQGVGGIDGHECCIGLEVNGVRLIMPRSTWEEANKSLERLLADI